jgi:cell division initiation protein
MFNSEDHSTTVTPLDLRQAKFATALRGFDKTEVTALLEAASAGFEQAVRENERLRQEMERLEASLNQYRDIEGSLKSTLISAQKLADDVRENARQEAARIVREAEGKAQILMQQAHARVEEAQREIDALKLKRREAEMQIEGTISALQHTLEFVREQDRRDRQDKIVPHRPRVEAAVRG